MDKFNTVEFLNKHNIPAPKTSLASNKCSQDFPIILKARKGRGNTAVFKITSEEDLKKHSKNQTSEFVFQELLSPDDEEYTCGVYKSRIDNSIHTIVLKRTLGTDSTIKAELVEDQEISDYVEAIAKASSMHGSFNIQLRKTTSGPFCFEVNPRFSSTIVMRDMLGFQDVLWSINEIMGDAATYNGPSHPSGTIIYKTPDFLMM